MHSISHSFLHNFSMWQGAFSQNHSSVWNGIGSIKIAFAQDFDCVLLGVMLLLSHLKFCLLKKMKVPLPRLTNSLCSSSRNLNYSQFIIFQSSFCHSIKQHFHTNLSQETSVVFGILDELADIRPEGRFLKWAQALNMRKTKFLTQENIWIYFT